jgi:HEAT repeat protein
LEQREQALFSFVQVTEPTSEVDSWLRQLHEKNDDLSNSSLLVLAAMGNRVRESDVNRFQEINDYVIASASNPSLDLEKQVVGLDAIANLGPSQVPEVVMNALKNDEPLVREKAVSSLERVSDPEAYGLIQQVLQADTDDRVRAAAAKLLADTRWQGGLEDLSYVAIHDISEQVRSTAVRSMGDWLEGHPEASAVLQQAANQDPSDDVRQVATDILKAHTQLEAAQTAMLSEIGARPN